MFSQHGRLPHEIGQGLEMMRWNYSASGCEQPFEELEGNGTLVGKRSFLLGIGKRLIQPGSLSTIKGSDSGAE